jgi:hypothetical protein
MNHSEKVLLCEGCEQPDTLILGKVIKETICKSCPNSKCSISTCNRVKLFFTQNCDQHTCFAHGIRCKNIMNLEPCQLLGEDFLDIVNPDQTNFYACKRVICKSSKCSYITKLCGRIIESDFLKCNNHQKIIQIVDN